MSWYLAVLKKYAVFGGRARRKEYWMFALVNAIITFSLGFVEGLSGMGPIANQSVLALLYTLVILVPSLAVGVRRLHDTGRSGWWMLIVVIPVIGALALLVFAVQDSSPGQNEYGPSPKGAVA